MFELSEDFNDGARIKVIGVGGGGGNAVESMMSRKINGVEFVVVNTDAQVLKRSSVPVKLQIGADLTRGLGAGGSPDIGKRAALESSELLYDAVRGADMIFITAGMGGGTGTGATSIIARMAREMGVLTVGVVTRPFSFEGKVRQSQAEKGLAELGEAVDTLITIPNDRLLEMEDNLSFKDAFRVVDDVLYQSVKGISELIVEPALVNLDFADVRAVMTGMGRALMGIGVGHGVNKAREAAELATSSPLLENASIEGARGLLIQIVGGHNMTLKEVTEASNIIQEKAHKDANIIWGAGTHDGLEDEIRVTLIATGFDGRDNEKDLSKRIENVKRLHTAMANNHNVLDIPTHLRLQGKGGVSDKGDLEGSLFAPDQDLDPPTFLRRKMKDN
ncbi:MAG: cell division protein FtsZ [Nitrospinae bacterium]|nr:cell division protein FtsZ [Nitrospinota bacterium]